LLRSPLLNLAADPLEFRSLDVEVVAECLAWRCSWGVPPPGLPVVLVALEVFWCLPLLDEALWMLMVGWLFRGPDLRSLVMSLQPDSIFEASSWVAFCGCSLELTNSERQCWGSRVRSLEANELQRGGIRT
jgi:hypothetical protein